MSEVRRRKIVHASMDRSAQEDMPAALTFDKIVTELRMLLATEFERGAADAAARILQLAVANDGRGRNHLPTEPIKRAPRGAARLLVERALKEKAMTIREVREVAQSPVEKFLSYQTVRLELERGLKQKRYRKLKDKWLLA